MCADGPADLKPGMKGVRWLSLASHADARGELRVCELGNPLDFKPARVFFISRCPPGSVRACHAVSSPLGLVALTGSLQVDLDNGESVQTHHLADPGTLLALQAGVWLRLSAFTPDACLMVLSAQTFKEVRYFDRPQPALIT